MEDLPEAQIEGTIKGQPKTGFLEKLKIHKFKILVGVLGTIIFASAVFGAYKFGQRQARPEPAEGPTPTPIVEATPTLLPSEVSTKEDDSTANWKTYRFEKSYKRGELKFEMRYPKEWHILEESESVRWYLQNPKEYLFSVSWLNPDVFYGVEGFCVQDMCNKISEVRTKEGINIGIWKPTVERRKQLYLTDNYLHAEISNSEKYILPSFVFGTPSLKLELFTKLLSTFKFLE